MWETTETGGIVGPKSGIAGLGAHTGGVDYDTIIVGGGPAGLSAAIVLGRCGRRVLVVDSGRGRNFASSAVHNFLSRDGVDPAALRRAGREELAKYGVEFREGLATGASCTAGGFEVEVDKQDRFASRTLLLATGVVDALPHVPGLRELYGRGVHHCPYCDGWEYRGRRLAAYGEGKKALGLGMSLLTWSKDVVVVTDGSRLTRGEQARAARHGLAVRVERVVEIVDGTRSPEARRAAHHGQGGDQADARPGPGVPSGVASGARRDGATGERGGEGEHHPPNAASGGTGDPVLHTIRFDSGAEERVAAVFFNTGQVQRSDLPKGLGCRMTADGGVSRDRRQRTGVPGLYLAGDASKDVQFVVVAAAEGAKAGLAINAELQKSDRGEK